MPVLGRQCRVFCGVSPCEENELPPSWRNQKDKKDCEQRSRSKVDQTLPIKDKPKWTDKQDKLWIIQDEDEEYLSYVNLKLNKEKYTGYGATSGADSAARIWRSIYLENCFFDSMDECLEERIFYRLISGFHGSTTAHICENFVNDDGVNEPNLNLYAWRLGMFPDRIQNIYFTFLFLLKAAHVARHTLIAYPFETGEDSDISARFQTLFSNDFVCNSPFDEGSLFADPNKEKLKDTLRAKFRNISMIMDCVSCETCKVHAKLQILGIGTALRILIDENSEEVSLERNEVVAMINSLMKFSDSIAIHHKMQNRENSRVMKNTFAFFFGFSFVVFCLVRSLLTFLSQNSKKMK
jgi:ERO1-like protein alpha